MWNAHGHERGRHAYVHVYGYENVGANEYVHARGLLPCVTSKNFSKMELCTIQKNQVSDYSPDDQRGRVFPFLSVVCDLPLFRRFHIF